MLLALLLLVGLARGARVWPVQSADALSAAVAHAEAGDTIELETGDYTVAAPLVVDLHPDRPDQQRLRDGAVARLRALGETP